MKEKIAKESEAQSKLLEEPEIIHKLALAKWKELKTSQFIVKVIIEKIKMQQELETKSDTLKMWSSVLEFKPKTLTENKFSKCIYYGQIKTSTGEPHGIGRICWTNNAIYEGLFVKGVRTGYGRIIFANGGYYEGFFKDDQFEGEGKQSLQIGIRA